MLVLVLGVVLFLECTPEMNPANGYAADVLAHAEIADLQSVSNHPAEKQCQCLQSRA